MTSEATDIAALERELPRALAADLTAAGALRSRRWIAAFDAVPRHLFVPRIFIDRDHAGRYELLDGREPGRRRQWLEQAYADEPLVTKLDNGTWLSSSTQPSLMAIMLESLSVSGTERVLEVGTGTGYNAALLSAGLGSSQVTSVDIDATLVDAARRRLRSLGYSPVLAAGDGAAGYLDTAPYDRIIATCSMPRIPPCWLAQTTQGGLILANLYRELGGGALALLTTDGDRATGGFLPIFGGFMPTRTEPSRSGAELLSGRRDGGTARPTAVDADVLDDDAFSMFAALRLPGVQRLGLLPEGQPEQTWLLDRTGSWAYQDGHAGPVTQGGPARLWDRLEDIHRDWTGAGRPRRDELGLTVTADGSHLLWRTAPDGPTWTL
jgi:methyltransferase of ATP-grasp peptide maturase system